MLGEAVLVLEAVVDCIDWYAACIGTEAIERHWTISWLLTTATAKSPHRTINDQLKLLRQLDTISQLQCTATFTTIMRKQKI